MNTLTATLVVMRDNWPISISVDWWRHSMDQWEEFCRNW